MSDSAPGLIWRNAGAPAHKYQEESYGGPCATCGVYAEEGVSTEEVNNPTFANHAEFFKFGTHVCRACAWLYGDPKRTHRNVLAVGDRLWWPMISVESATEERPSWLELLTRVARDPLSYPNNAPLCGVLTTDPKPRNWPRMRLSTVGAMGLYTHAPDYDTSAYREQGLLAVLGATQPILRALRMGFSKARIHSGLLADYTKVKRNPEGVMRLEEELRNLREEPEFVPALLVSGIKKEERGGDRGANQEPEPTGATRGQAREDEHRLF